MADARATCRRRSSRLPAQEHRGGPDHLVAARIRPPLQPELDRTDALARTKSALPSSLLRHEHTRGIVGIQAKATSMTDRTSRRSMHATFPSFRNS
jgi:hypothetical protein